MTIAEQAVAQDRKERIHREINSHKVEAVDRSIYTKTDQEKAKLYKLKNEWKIKVQNGYLINTVIHSGAYTALIGTN